MVIRQIDLQKESNIIPSEISRIKFIRNFLNPPLIEQNRNIGELTNPIITANCSTPDDFTKCQDGNSKRAFITERHF